MCRGACAQPSRYNGCLNGLNELNADGNFYKREEDYAKKRVKPLPIEQITGLQCWRPVLTHHLPIMPLQQKCKRQALANTNTPQGQNRKQHHLPSPTSRSRRASGQLQ